MDGLPQNTHRRQDENHSQDHTCSVDGEKQKRYVDKIIQLIKLYYFICFEYITDMMHKMPILRIIFRI